MTEHRPQAPLRSFGRRKGHRLRSGRRQLLESLLPRLRIDPSGPVDRESLFPRPIASLWLEIGFGAGEHLAAQARAHPDVGFVGCEPFVNGVAALLAEIDRDGLDNIRILDDDARLLLPALPDACLDRVFLLFADPWPKARHHKRRFLGPESLNALARLLGDGGELRFASDHMGHVRWALFHTLRHREFAWTAMGPEDWRRRPGDGLPTRYERKALQKGEACVYLTFRRRPREP